MPLAQTDLLVCRYPAHWQRWVKPSQRFDQHARVALPCDTVQNHARETKPGIEAPEAMHYRGDTTGRRRGVDHQQHWQTEQLRNLGAAALLIPASHSIE